LNHREHRGHRENCFSNYILLILQSIFPCAPFPSHLVLERQPWNLIPDTSYWFLRLICGILPPMSTAENPLMEIIADEIVRDGPISFARYMELCLYHPQHGYYQRGLTVTGREGDFYTSPHVHRFFGASIALWIEARCRELEIEKPAVVELGPGNGQLSRDILDQWATEPPGMEFSLTLVEGSGAQREYLSGLLSPDGADVLSPEDWDAIPSFDGIVIANEFFDALPLQILARENGELRQVRVEVENGALREILALLEPEQLDDALAGAAQALPEGHRMEFSSGWRDWLERIGEKLNTGSLLIIDYGDTLEALTAPWRRSGTLRCYSQHRVDSDPFEDPGNKDITAHLNFTLMEAWARELGFVVDLFTSQSSYLVRAGILDLLARLMEGKEDDPETVKEWLTIKNLIDDEGGMGEVFKVMVLSKG